VFGGFVPLGTDEASTLFVSDLITCFVPLGTDLYPRAQGPT